MECASLVYFSPCIYAPAAFVYFSGAFWTLFAAKLSISLYILLSVTSTLLSPAMNITDLPREQCKKNMDEDQDMYQWILKCNETWIYNSFVKLFVWYNAVYCRICTKFPPNKTLTKKNIWMSVMLICLRTQMTERQGTAIYYFLIRISLRILYSYHSWNPQYCIFHLTGGKQANGNFDQSLEGGGNF